MLNKKDFESYSYAFERYLLSLRMKLRRMEEQEEDDLLRIYYNHLGNTICQLNYGINESIHLGNWTSLIETFTETGIFFQTREDAENFIISIASNRIRVERKS